MKMAKCLTVLAITLATLLFSFVFPQPKTADADPNESEPNQPQSTRTDTNSEKTAPEEPNPTKHIGPPSEKTEPNNITSVIPEPNRPKPAKLEPNDPDPNDAARLKTEPNDPNAGSTVTFHDKCAAILKTYVDNKGMVDYSTLRRKRVAIKNLLNEFNKLDPNEYKSWPKNDKIAFWINAYNIQMLNIITKNYPIKYSRFITLLPGWGPKSIRHIDGIYTKYKFLVMDEAFTLSEIDKRFFRKEFADAGILLALTRANLSSPPLRNEPYYGHKLEKQLDDQAKKFLSNSLAFKIDRAKGKVYLSALFQKNEYGKQFLGKYAIDRKFKVKEPETRAVLNFITNYVSEEDKSFLEIGNYTVQFMGYNWTINDGSR